MTKAAVDWSSALRAARIVDLSHAFFPGQPHHPALPDQEVTAVVDFDSEYSSLVQQFRIVGQWGTHIDAPLHFHRSGLSLEQIPVKQAVLPLVVLDIHDRAERDPDTVASLDDVRRWEAAHGRIPCEAFVALRTDWSLRWPCADKLENIGADGYSHRPGWSRAVLEFLVNERAVTAIGHETADTDSGYSVSAKGDYSLERYFLGTGRWQIELLDNLRSVPSSGALIPVSWPKPKGGSGFPARAIAIFEDRSQ